MRPRAALLMAALLLAGCSGGNAATSNGFSAQPPGGWDDETDKAETRTGTDFEAVWDGGSGRALTIARVKVGKNRTLDMAAAAARLAVDRRYEEADPTPAEPIELDGERALRFDYGTGGKRARYVTAQHGTWFYAVTMQVPNADFDDAVKTLDDYLSGWRWQ